MHSLRAMQMNILDTVELVIDSIPREVHSPNSTCKERSEAGSQVQLLNC